MRVKKRALDSSVSLTEVVQRLLAAYADGRVKVGALSEAGRLEGSATPVRAPGSSLPASESAKPTMDELLEAGRRNRAVELGVDPDTGVIEEDNFHAEPFEEMP